VGLEAAPGLSGAEGSVFHLRAQPGLICVLYDFQRRCDLQLSDYPRPRNDNGRGVHWAPMTAYISDTTWSFWLDELKAMSITWVKLFDDGRGSALSLCKLLTENDIMPIVRFYRPNDGVSPLPAETLAVIRQFVAAGVHYFESINEPDLPLAWPGGHRPADWLDIATENFLADAKAIIDAGGLPALPAMAFSGQGEMVQRLIDRGQAEILSHGVWVAIHNYALNRPLDYPFDPVNQEGRPLTQDEYDAYSPWEWDGHTLSEINRWREEGKRPGAEIASDPLCFNAYQFIGQSIADLLGYPLPVISSEGGAVVGWKDDRRYPRLSPRRAAEMTLQMTNFVATVAPPWYFAICHWLLANQKIAPRQPDLWESQAWYTDWWDDTFNLSSVLPVVESLKDMPSLPRLNMAGGAQQAYLTGAAIDEEDNPLAGIAVTLRQNNEEVAKAISDGTGALAFGIVPPGGYELFVAERGQAGHLDLAPGEVKEITLTLHPLPGAATPPTPAERALPYIYRLADKAPGDASDAEEGILVRGQVVDENGEGLTGIPLRLSWQDADGQTRSLSTETGAEDESAPGAFQFIAPVSRFSLTVTAGDGESETALIEPDLEAGAETTGWQITFRREAKPQQSKQARIIGEVPGGRLGQELILNGPAGELRTTLNEAGQFYFADLPAGTYRLEMQYVGVIDNRLTVAKGEVQQIKFPVQSVIQGLIKGYEAGQMAMLEAETHHWTRSVAISPQGQFRFAELPPGRYHVRLGDHVTESVYVDGTQAYTFPTIDLRPPNRAAVEVETCAANGDRLPGQTVILRQGEAVIAQTQTALSGRTRFEALLPGHYQLFWQENNLSATLELVNDRVTPVRLQVSAEDTALYPLEIEASAAAAQQDDQPAPAGMAGLIGESSPSPAEKILGPEILSVPTAPLPETKPASQEKPLRLYVLFPVNSPTDSRARLLLAQIYIRRERGGSSGFDPNVALLAQKVVLVGGEEDFSPDLIPALREAGCQVELLSSNLFELEQQLRDKEQKVI